jgi:hypothetical protein
MNKQLRILIALVVCTLMPFTAWAQTAPAPQLSAEYFGEWRLNTTSGWSGTLVISPTVCQYTINSAFSHTQAFCQMVWVPEAGQLMIFGTNRRAGMQVPEYLPERPVTTLAGGSESLFTFTLNRMNPYVMRGHMSGAAENIHVVWRRHR